jgi:hypothetical protein
VVSFSEPQPGIDAGKTQVAGPYVLPGLGITCCQDELRETTVKSSANAGLMARVITSTVAATTNHFIGFLLS